MDRKFATEKLMDERAEGDGVPTLATTLADLDCQRIIELPDPRTELAAARAQRADEAAKQRA